MKIMLCYDGSEEAKRALKLAQIHAKAFAGKIFAITAMKSTPELELKEIEQAERLLLDVEKDCNGKQIDCETLALVHDLATGESLVQYAKDKKMEELVIGIRKTSKVGKILFGSTAQYVILESECPVATIK